MYLTPAQQQTLKTFIAAVPEWEALPKNGDGAYTIAQALNLTATPAFVVWKTSLATADVMANGFTWTDIDALTGGKARIWEWMSALGQINPSKANVRQGLRDCFGAASATYTGMLPHMKRSATVLEQVFATGTGTDAAPATMNVEGSISYQDVEAVRNL